MASGSHEDERLRLCQDLTAVADRFDDLAETADLMGDEAGAQRFRLQASDRRMEAMRILDDGAAGAG